VRVREKLGKLPGHQWRAVGVPGARAERKGARRGRVGAGYGEREAEQEEGASSHPAATWCGRE